MSGTELTTVREVAEVIAFVANSDEEALAMIRRFQSGAMGRLEPTPGAFE